MKKIKVVAILLFLHQSIFAQPETSYYSSGSTAVAGSTSVPLWYKNLEKYWFYRYRQGFYVAKDYKLMPLNKVADYVRANNHLPDVPSAEDVKKEGIDLGSMDAKLLQKIVELTLYVIQQEEDR